MQAKTRDVKAVVGKRRAKRDSIPPYTRVRMYALAEWAFSSLVVALVGTAVFIVAGGWKRVFF